MELNVLDDLAKPWRLWTEKIDVPFIQRGWALHVSMTAADARHQNRMPVRSCIWWSATVRAKSRHGRPPFCVESGHCGCTAPLIDLYLPDWMFDIPAIVWASLRHPPPCSVGVTFSPRKKAETFYKQRKPTATCLQSSSLNWEIATTSVAKAPSSNCFGQTTPSNSLNAKGILWE